MDVTSAVLALGSSPLVVFAAAVIVDDLLGVALAVKTKTFDAKKLPSFLESQFGTKEFLVVAAAAFAAYETGGDAKAAATAVVVAGGFALTVAVGKDILDKIKAFVYNQPVPMKAAKVAKK
jgi:hypothetical protein